MASNHYVCRQALSRHLQTGGVLLDTLKGVLGAASAGPQRKRPRKDGYQQFVGNPRLEHPNHKVKVFKDTLAADRPMTREELRERRIRAAQEWEGNASRGTGVVAAKVQGEL